MAQTKSVDLTGGKFAKWGDLSLHPNKKATKAWAMLVTGTSEKFGVDGDWLDKTTIDGKTNFDVSALAPGDFIKVSGASHNNKKIAYYRIESNDGDTLDVERLSESDVIEALESGDDAEDLRRDVIEAAREVDDVEDLEAALDVLGGR